MKQLGLPEVAAAPLEVCKKRKRPVGVTLGEDDLERLVWLQDKFEASRSAVIRACILHSYTASGGN
jgi:hypothetical protein